MVSTNAACARIGRHIKEEATIVLAKMDLFVSDDIRILLTRIAADKTLRFDVDRVPPFSERKSHDVVPEKI